MGQYHLDDHCTIHVNQKQRRFWGGSFDVLIELMMLIWLMVLINLDVHAEPIVSIKPIWTYLGTDCRTGDGKREVSARYS